MFRISNYWALGFLLLIPYAFYLSKTSLAELSAWRRWTTFAIRSILIISLVLALAEFELIQEIDKLCVVFAIDVSNSIPPGDVHRAVKMTKEIMDTMNEADAAGAIIFGGQAHIDTPIQTKREIVGMFSDASPEYTDLAGAIKLALDLFPEACQKKIVLISDGNENTGDALDIAKLAKIAGAQIYSLPLSTKGMETDEIIMSGLIGPGRANIGRIFELRAVVESTVDTAATLRLLRNRDYLNEMSVQLSAAQKNVFHFKENLDKEGTYVYEVLIEPLIDTIRENNRAETIVTTGGRPKVLYMSEDETNATYLHRILINRGIEAKLSTAASDLPTSLSEMQNYSAIIFDDISADSFSTMQMETIESYVHDLGGGFVMIGGENSFGSGQYADTPIENVLPLKMIPEQKKRSLSIVLAIDKSGSMVASSGRYAKIDLAKEAANSVINLLTEKDQVGVVAFDAAAEAVVSLDKINSKWEIENSIAGIETGGGTNAYPALEMAHRWLRNSDTQLKHVILLSDGKSQQSEELSVLAGRMATDKITISTIAIGIDADRERMQGLADLGLGRYHETKEAGDLPRIFVKEVFAATQLLVERDFNPVVSESSEILKGIEQLKLPLLRGYIGTAAKDGASVPIISDAGDPILSIWQYGLGRALAFTSDIKPRWAARWLTWDKFSKFWSQAIGWSLAVPSGEFHVSANIVGSTGLIAVDAIDSKGRFRNFLDFQASIIDPSLSHQRLSLKQVAPGRYEGEFDAGKMGAYMAHIGEMKDGQIINSQNTGAIVPYSPEYRNTKPNHALLEALSAATNGKFRPEISEIVAHGEANARNLQSFWQFLLLLSIPLFFLDVAMRRLAVSREQISEFMGRIQYRENNGESGTQEKTLMELRRRKNELWKQSKPQNQELRTRKVKSDIRSKSKIKKDASAAQPATEFGETYTSRLLKAKKRIE